MTIGEALLVWLPRWPWITPIYAERWLSRAHRLLEGLDTGPEHGWLTLYEGYLALELVSDTMEAQKHSAEAKGIAHALNLFDLQVLSVALEGLALVREGKIVEGMRCMDEATTAVIAGEMTDLNAIGNTCCSLIYACASVADYTRASELCERLMEFSRRWRLGSLLAFRRTYYGIILLWHGDWTAGGRPLHNRDA